MCRNLIVIVSALLLLHSGIVAQSPVPDCGDRKDKIELLKKSISKLAEFKTGDGTVDGADTTYKSYFELCGKKAVVVKK